jgi:hypothetical protein
MGPVVDDGIEDGADVGVDVDFGVEAVYERVLISCSVIFRSVFKVISSYILGLRRLRAQFVI